MRHLLSGVAAVLTIAVIGPAQAQAPWPGPPLAAYPDPNSYRFLAPTPDDAYRQRLINRWEYERLEGPLPPALQGPSPNGSRGVEPGS